MKIPEQGITYRASRRAYIGNYLLAALVIILLVIVYVRFDFQPSFFPRDPAHIWDMSIVLAFLAIASFLIEEPIFEGIVRRYVVTNNEVVKIEGILRKKRYVIPYQAIADIRVSKGIFGRIFNYGSVEIFGFKENIDMKNVTDPEGIQRMIQNKISIVREPFVKRKVKQEHFQKE